MAETTKETTPEKDATPVKDTKDAEWEGKFDDVTNHQRAFTITESDGTLIEVRINWPGRVDAENLQGLSYGSYQGMTRDTMGTYHEALLDLFTTPKVNGKPHAPLDMNFFEDADNQSDRNKTYGYLMDKSDSFLTGLLG